VFCAIVQYAQSTSTTSLLIPHLTQVETWIKIWQLDLIEIRNLYLVLSNAFFDSHLEKSFHYLLQYLGSCKDVADEDVETVAQLAAKAAVLAIRLVSVKDFDQVVDVIAIQNLQKIPKYQSLYKLFQIFLHGKVEDYQQFESQNSEMLNTYG
jgi:hypothetical protein